MLWGKGKCVYNGLWLKDRYFDETPCVLAQFLEAVRAVELLAHGLRFVRFLSFRGFLGLLHFDAIAVLSVLGC